MGKKSTRSSGSIVVPNEFEAQNLLENPMDEVCTFTDRDIAALQKSGTFPDTAVFRPYDRNAKSDFVSDVWFFETTGMAFAQAMPEVRRILVCSKIVENHGVPLKIGDLSAVYKLRTHGSSRFILQLIHKNPPFLSNVIKSERSWKSKFFFIRRDSIPNGENIPKYWLKSGTALEKLAPPLEDSFLRIKQVKELPSSAKTFEAEESQSTSQTTAMSIKKAAFFDLEDIDSQEVTKPVKAIPPTVSKMPSPPPKTKGNTSKKRKGTVAATAEPSLFEDLTPQEVLAKISQLSLQGHEHVLKSLDDM